MADSTGVELLNFPLVNIVNALVDFFRYTFTTPGMTPAQWRYDPDMNKSKVIIRGGFGGKDLKVGGAPEIVVARGSFGFSNQLLDNLESADANVFSNMVKRDWLVGSVDVICNTRSQNESDCLASFLAILLQSNRHQIRKQLPFLKDLKYAAIGPSTPGEEDVEQRRWLTTLRLNVELNTNWTTIETQVVTWNQLEMYTVQDGNAYESNTGSVAIASNTLVDVNADFGLVNTSGMQFNSAELAQGWYYVFLDGNTTKYKVVDVVDNHTLHIVYEDNRVDHDIDLTEAFAGKYKIVWNNVHFGTTLVAS